MFLNKQVYLRKKEAIIDNIPEIDQTLYIYLIEHQWVA